ncbi:MAG: hypothetical protein GF307_06650 [candidate division Zixibacteria bacterium]|nr:hypothetical protein [candidate division Zixibacteria bacterium]
MTTRNLIVVSLLIILTVLNIASSARGAKYTLKANYIYDARKLNCSENILYINETAVQQNTIFIRFYQRFQYQTAPLNDSLSSSDSIIINNHGISIKKSLCNGLKCEIIPVADSTIGSLTLQNPCAPGDSVLIAIDYSIALPPLNGRLGYFSTGALFSYWYPQLCPVSNNKWFVRPYIGFADFFNNYADYDIEITIPALYKIAASGIPSSEYISDSVGVYTYNVYAIPQFAFAIGDYNLKEFQFQGIDVKYYYLDSVDDLQIFEHCSSASIEFLTKNLGYYLFPALNIVHIPRKGAELSFPMFIAQDLYRAYPGKLRNIEHSLVRNIARQYFPNAAMNDQYAEGWLDEGINNYITGKIEEKIGNYALIDVGSIEMRSEHIHRLASYSLPSGGKTVWPADKFTNRNSYWDYIYRKSSMFFNAVESVIGEEQLLKIIGEYYKSNSFGYPDTDSLIMRVKTSVDSSGYDGARLIDYYLHEDTYCDYSIEDVSVNANEVDSGVYSYHTEVKVKRDGTAWLPVNMMVTFKDDSKQKFILNSPEVFQRYEFMSDSYPVLLEIDAEGINLLDNNIMDNSYKPQGVARARSIFQSTGLFYLESLISLITGF